MKKLISLMLLLAGLTLLWTPCVNAEKWTTANQITVAWDPVTVATGTVSYKVYYKPVSIPEPETMYASGVTATQLAITFTKEGRYYLGVRAVRTVDGIDLESSTISWSNNPADVQGGETFGIQYYDLPKGVGGIRILP